MTMIFRLEGDYSSSPTSGQPSGQPDITSPLSELMYLSQHAVLGLDLTSDPAVSVPFGSLSGANVVVIKAVGGPIKVTLTSSAGSAQAITVDGFATLMSETNAYTAMTVQRTAGIEATVNIFLGQAST